MNLRKRLIHIKDASPAPDSPEKPQPVRKRNVVKEKDWPSDGISDGDNFVARCVRLADTAPEASRAGSTSIHVSALVGGDWCPRSHLIHQRHIPSQMDMVQSQMRIVWALGRAAEKHVREQFIKMHGRHRVLGVWTCACEAAEKPGFGDYTSLCQKCGTALDVYGELSLVDEEANLCGHSDLVFVTKAGEIEVTEIKSIKKDGFAALVKPDPTHVLQCASYRRILKKTLPGNPKVTGRILYVAKDYISPKVSPYLEFNLPDEDPPILDVLREQAIDLRQHEGKDSLPKRLTVCDTPHSTKAKNCGACALCFSLP
jgi:hypothetical protein